MMRAASYAIAALFTAGGVAIIYAVGKMFGADLTQSAVIYLLLWAILYDARIVYAAAIRERNR